MSAHPAIAPAGSRPPPGVERGDPRTALLVFLSLPLLGVVALALGLAFGVRGTDVTILLLAVALAIVSLLPLAFDLARPPSRRHVLLAIVSIVYMLHFVMPAFAVYIPAVGPVDPSGMETSQLFPSGVVRGQAMALLGLVMLLVGYALPLGRGLAVGLPTPRYEWTQNATLITSTVLIGLGWMLYAALQFGLVPRFVGTGVVGGISHMTLYGSAILTIGYVRYRSRTALIFLVVLVSITTFFNLFTGSKRRFLTPIAMIVMTWMVMQGRLRVRWLAIGVLTVIVIYPVSQFYRDVVSVGRTKSAVEVLRDPGDALARMSEFVAATPPSEYLQSGLEAVGNRLDGLGRASVIIRDTGTRVPFQGGRTLALIPVAYVPRILWPSKPDITIGQWITDNYGAGAHIDARVGPSWIGEFYLNFGTPGVIFGMAIMGMLIRLCHELLFKRGGTTLSIMAGTIVLYQLMLGVGGGIVNVVNGSVFGIAPLLIAHVFVRMLGGAYRRVPGDETEAPIRSGRALPGRA